MALGFAVTAAGIQTAISRFVSSELAQNNPAGARLYFRIGLLLSAVFICRDRLCNLKYADFIGVSMLGDVRCIPLLRSSPLLVPCCIHACINGCYYGQKKTGVPSHTAHRADRPCRHGLAALSDPYAGADRRSALRHNVGSCDGRMASTLVSVSVAKLPEGTDTALSVKCGTRNLLAMAVPLTANRVVLTLFSSFENIMIPSRLRLFGYTASEALGVYGILTGMAMSVIMFPSVITNSVSVLLMPAISEAKAGGNDALIRRAVLKPSGSVFCGAFFVQRVFLLPVTLSGMCFWERARRNIYTDARLDLSFPVPRRDAEQYSARARLPGHHFRAESDCLRHPHPLCAVCPPRLRHPRLSVGLHQSAVMALLPSEFCCARHIPLPALHPQK